MRWTEGTAGNESVEDHMRKPAAAVIALAMPCLAYVLVVAVLGDGIFGDTSVPPGRDRRAALAIRDHVTPFQEWGSKIFTWGYLNRYYGAAWYFTQSKGGKAKKVNLRDAFVTCLDQALAKYESVDLYLLAHTNEYVDWVAALPAERRQRLRLVYNTGCHNLPQGAQWLELGADAYVGHPGVSSSSVFYYFFLRRWTRGGTLQEATDASNALAATAFRQYEWFTLGRSDAAWLIKESTASLSGSAQLHLEDRAE